MVYSALKPRRLSGWRGVWAGALPPGWFFPSAALVYRGKRQPHPPPAAGHHARHMLPVPRPLPPPRSPLCHLRPHPTWAVRLHAPTPGPLGRLLTWASTWAGCGQWQGGASPRPLCATPPEGAVDPGFISRCCPSLLLLRYVGVGGVGGGRGVVREAWMEEGAFPRKRKEVSVTVCTLGDCKMKSERNAQICPFNVYMLISGTFTNSFISP